MEEYIKRSELQKAMQHVYEDSTCPLHIAAEVDQYITETPAADVVEVVHGRWGDRYGGKYANPLYECSECKGTARYQQNYDVLDNGLWLQDLTDYCPHCGAKMDGGADNAQTD